jgi:hypothetical protein
MDNNCKLWTHGVSILKKWRQINAEKMQQDYTLGIPELSGQKISHIA